jgi:hypothetical protein
MLDVDDIPRVPPWESLLRVLGEGRKAEFIIDGSPAARLETSGETGPLAVLIECPEPFEVEQLSGVQFRFRAATDHSWLEIVTTDPKLIRNLYDLGLEIIDEAQLRQTPLSDALATAMDNWRRMVRRPPLLSVEVATGLAGELWFLDQIINRFGPEHGLRSWTGPAGAIHDFLINGVDIEVKSTRRSERKHVIDNVAQLEPSVERSLFLLSVHFQPGGDDGESLRNRIENIRSLLTPTLRTEFNTRLQQSFKLSEEAIDRETDTLVMRDTPRLVPVDNSFPRISRGDLEAMQFGNSERLSEVGFTVDVTDLGFAQGTNEFTELIRAT